MTSDTALQVQQLGSIPQGLVFNQAMCDASQGAGEGQPCTHTGEGWSPAGPGNLKTLSMMVAYNASGAPYNAITLAAEDSMAILTPNATSVPGGKAITTTTIGGTAFQFSTLGARASCKYLNDNCVKNLSPEAAFVLGCGQAGWPQLPVNTTADDTSESIYAAYAPASGALSDTRVFSVRNNSIGYLAANLNVNVQEFPPGTWSANPATVGL